METIFFLAGTLFACGMLFGLILVIRAITGVSEMPYKIKRLPPSYWRQF